MKPEIIPHRPNERCAYAQKGVLKRAALLFDRIHCSGPADDIPSALLFDVPDAHRHWKAVTDAFVKKLKETLPPGRMYNKEHLEDVITQLDARMYVVGFRPVWI